MDPDINLLTKIAASPQRMLQGLLAMGKIDLCDAPLLHSPPPAFPSGPDWDRVEGMLLGVAIGDALGQRSEGMLPRERRAEFGEIRDYLVHARAGYTAKGVPSDDSQMTFWTLEQLLEDGRLDPERLLEKFASWRIKGIGGTVKAALDRFAVDGRPWYEAGVASAGNGALMRIAPLPVPYLRRPSPDLWADTAIAAMVTHNDAASTAACIAFVRMLWLLLSMDVAPQPAWWLERYAEAAAPLEGEAHKYEPRGGAWAGAYEGPLWRFVQEKVSWAWERQIPVLEACNMWHSAAYLMETLPCALYILMHHGHEPEEAIVRAVNGTKDNDTVAAIAGAAVGALHGAKALPERWRANLTGRTLAGGKREGEDVDDRRIFQLIDQARARWG